MTIIKTIFFELTSLMIKVTEYYLNSFYGISKVVENEASRRNNVLAIKSQFYVHQNEAIDL